MSLLQQTRQGARGEAWGVCGAQGWERRCFWTCPQGQRGREWFAETRSEYGCGPNRLVSTHFTPGLTSQAQPLCRHSQVRGGKTQGSGGSVSPSVRELAPGAEKWREGAGLEEHPPVALRRSRGCPLRTGPQRAGAAPVAGGAVLQPADRGKVVPALVLPAKPRLGPDQV